MGYAAAISLDGPRLPLGGPKLLAVTLTHGSACLTIGATSWYHFALNFLSRDFDQCLF